MLCNAEVSFAQSPDPKDGTKREIIIGDKRFRVYNNWFSGGAGLAANTKNPYMQAVLAANINFHLKYQYFRIGVMLSGDNFRQRNNVQFHAGWIPYRKETGKYNFAAMACVSYATGYRFTGPPHQYDNLNPYATWGGYAEAQYIRKMVYDVGIGGAFFVNVNAENTIIGIRADFYLSGAYKGYVKGREPQKAPVESSPLR